MTHRERQLLRWIEEDPLISQQELADKAGITRSSVAVHISNLMKKGYIAGKGYIVRSSPYAVVIGGATLEIGGYSNTPLTANNAHPGSVKTRLGGTGLNIAHNITLLGMDTHLITALGDDLAAQRITASCSDLGISTSHTLRVPGASTSTALFLTEPDGEPKFSVIDADIYERLTPDFLGGRLPFLNNAQFIVIDANIPEETIRWVTENCRLPIFADPASPAKAEKLRAVLGRLHTLKANRLETEKLSGIPLTSRNNLERTADVLLATGLRRLFITLGPDGVFAADQRERYLLPCLPGSKVNSAGCGDAFIAAAAWGYPEGTCLEHTARAGLAAASIALESAECVNPALCAAQVHQRSGISCISFQYRK